MGAPYSYDHGSCPGCGEYIHSEDGIWDEDLGSYSCEGCILYYLEGELGISETVAYYLLDRILSSSGGEFILPKRI